MRKQGILTTFVALSPGAKRKIAGKQMEFSLAVFMIAAGKDCYFEYSNGYGVKGGIFDHYTLPDREPGVPLGKPTRKGYLYTRDYENCAVRVDPENEQAEICWK